MNFNNREIPLTYDELNSLVPAGVPENPFQALMETAPGETVPLSYEELIDFKEAKRLLQVEPSLIKLFLPNFEPLVGSFHVHTFVFIGSASDHNDELFLPCSLFLHIDIFKEGTSNWVTKHILIELINYSVDGSLSTKSLV
jgi:hypothetical protein